MPNWYERSLAEKGKILFERMAERILTFVSKWDGSENVEGKLAEKQAWESS